MIDAGSQTILAWEFTGPWVSDTTVFPTLVERIEGPLGDVYADAGYLSYANAQLVTYRGGTPYFRLKSTTKGRPPGSPGQHYGVTKEPLWRMIDSSRRDPTKWYQKYHRRSTIESTWSAIKRRLYGVLPAFSLTMRRVETGLKVLVWNLTRVSQEGF